MSMESIAPPSSFVPGLRPALSDDVAKRYVPRVRRHAARFARRLPRHVTIADLVSAGYAGLVDAFDRFDAARTASFDAYVDQRIKGAILDELRSYDPLTRDQRAFARRLAAAQSALATSLGRAPDQAELAAALGLSLAALHQQLGRMSVTAAHATATTDDDGVAEASPDDSCLPDEAVERAELRGIVGGALARLPARQQQVMRMYYDDGLTLRQIAEQLGVTESRISQIHSEAIGRIRALVGGMN